MRLKVTKHDNRKKGHLQMVFLLVLESEICSSIYLLAGIYALFFTHNNPHIIIPILFFVLSGYYFLQHYSIKQGENKSD
ncbi:hypothetical protein CHH73_09310 [Shouchella clausii]|nr:hypothetical protein CHH73_09310 [Shouchella clausii]